MRKHWEENSIIVKSVNIDPSVNLKFYCNCISLSSEENSIIYGVLLEILILKIC